MKLLKLLATGVVALSISTSSMAGLSVDQKPGVGDLIALKYRIEEQGPGPVKAKALALALVVVVGIIFNIRQFKNRDLSTGVTDVTLPQGRLSNVLADAGPVVEQSGDGQLNEQVFMSQAGFDLTDASNAISSCAQQSTSRVRYHLPSKEDLLALVKALPKLRDNFELASKNPSRGFYHPSQEEIAEIKTDIGAFEKGVSGGGALLTSNQAGAGTAVTVDANGTVGAVAKDALTPYICVSYFTSRMLEKQSLLSR